MITVQIDDRVIMARLNAMPTRLRDRLERTMTTLSERLKSTVKDSKLSGQVLNVRTGNLRRSIKSEVTTSATSVSARVFSDATVKYAAIHEFGGVINRVGRIKGPYQIRMPARPFMLPTFEDMKPEIETGIDESVREALLP